MLFGRNVLRMGLGLLAGLCLSPLIALSAPLTAADKAEIVKAETYLNQISTLKARFLQISPSGNTVEGTIFMSRPGKLRLEYDPPSPILVIADGSFLIYIDKQLQQTSYLPLNSSPAGILVREHVELDSGELKVVKVSHAPGMLGVTVIKTDEADQGSITLIFTEQPFALRQWHVLDQQGQTTTVSLFDAKRDIAMDKELFRFKDPRYTGDVDISPSRDR